MINIPNPQTIYDLPKLNTIMKIEPLPDFVKMGLLHNEHVTHGKYSVTELLDHPRCTALRKIHPDLKLDDPTKMAHAMNGTAVHAYWEKLLTQKCNPACIQCEVAVFFKINDIDISGSIDIIHRKSIDLLINETTIIDIKNWTSYKWMQKDMADVIDQLNSYYYGYYLGKSPYNHQVKLGLLVFIRDWHRGASHRKNYPPSSLMYLEFAPKPMEKIKENITKRVKLFEDYKNVNIDDYPDADDKATWSRLEAYRVYKVGGNNAIRGGVFRPEDYESNVECLAATEEKMNATQLANPKEEYYFKECNTERKRCAEYCPVADMCNTYQNSLKESYEAPQKEVPV